MNSEIAVLEGGRLPTPYVSGEAVIGGVPPLATADVTVGNLPVGCVLEYTIDNTTWIPVGAALVALTGLAVGVITMKLRFVKNTIKSLNFTIVLTIS